jgi:hypothetical protein
LLGQLAQTIDAFSFSHRHIVSSCRSKRADREIAQPQIGKAASFPEPEQRIIQGQPHGIVAFLDGDADPFAEILALEERAAGERAAPAGIGTIDPERQCDAVAEDVVDFTAPQRISGRIRYR